MRIGRMKWFDRDKGFGFIEAPGQRDIFVHFEALEPPGDRAFDEGAPVEYEAVETPKGVRATKVRRLPPGHAPA